MAELNALVVWVAAALWGSVVCAAILVLPAGVVEVVARGRALRLRQALWALVLLSPLLGSGAGLLGRLAAGGRPAAGPGASPWMVAATVAWLCGVGTAAAFVVARRRHVRRVLAMARPVRTRGCMCAAAHWLACLGIRRPVQVLASPACRSPFTVGMLSPVVVLPEVIASGWSDELRLPVIGHELAHVARWDGLWLWVADVTEALLFFHPAVWLAARRLSPLRERLCDELVVRRGGVSPRQYLRSLRELARWRAFGRWPKAALSLVGAVGEAKVRTRGLLGKGAPTGGRRWPAWTTTTVLALVLLPMAGAPKLRSPAGVPSAAAGRLEMSRSGRMVRVRCHGEAGRPGPDGWMGT